MPCLVWYCVSNLPYLGISANVERLRSLEAVDWDSFSLVGGLHSKLVTADNKYGFEEPTVSLLRCQAL